MEGYLIVGIIVGSVLWWCKFILSIAILPKCFNKWMHNSPIGLFLMDSIFGVLAVKTITMAGASGLVTLIVLVSYGTWTGLLILKFLLLKKSKELGGKLYELVP